MAQVSAQRLRAPPDEEYEAIWRATWKSRILLSRFCRGEEKGTYRDSPRLFAFRRVTKPGKKVFGAQKWKRVFLIVVEPFIFYFDDNVPTAVCRGSVYLGHGCEVVSINEIDGRRNVICLAPVIVRRPGYVAASDEENNFFFAFSKAEHSARWWSLLSDLATRHKARAAKGSRRSSVTSFSSGDDNDRAARSITRRNSLWSNFLSKEEVAALAQSRAASPVEDEGAASVSTVSPSPLNNELPVGPEAPEPGYGVAAPLETDAVGGHTRRSTFLLDSTDVSDKRVVLLTTEGPPAFGKNVVIAQVNQLLKAKHPPRKLRDFPPLWILRDAGYEVVRSEPALREVVFMRRKSYFSLAREMPVNTDYIHHGACCNHCRSQPIFGFMYRCAMCPAKENAVYCGSCFHQLDHDPRHSFRVFPDPMRCAAPLGNGTTNFRDPDELGATMYSTYSGVGSMISPGRRPPPPETGSLSRPMRQSSPVPLWASANASQVHGTSTVDVAVSGRQPASLSSYIAPSLEGSLKAFRVVELIVLEGIFRLIGNQTGESGPSEPVPKRELLYFWEWSGVSPSLRVSEEDLATLCRRVDSVSFEEFVFLVRCKLTTMSSFDVVVDEQEGYYLGSAYAELLKLHRREQELSRIPGGGNNPDLAHVRQRCHELAITAGMNRLFAMLRAFDYAEVTSHRSKASVAAVYLSQLLLIVSGHAPTLVAGWEGESGQPAPRAKVGSYFTFSEDVEHYLNYDPTLVACEDPEELVCRTVSEVQKRTALAEPPFSLSCIECATLLVVLQCTASPRRIARHIVSSGIIKLSLLDSDAGEDDSDGDGGVEADEEASDEEDLGGDGEASAGADQVGSQRSGKTGKGSVASHSSAMPSREAGGASVKNSTNDRTSMHSEHRPPRFSMKLFGKKTAEAPPSILIPKQSVRLPSPEQHPGPDPRRSRKRSGAVEEVVPLAVCCEILRRLMWSLGVLSRNDTEDDALLEVFRHYYGGVAISHQDLRCFPTNVLKTLRQGAAGAGRGCRSDPLSPRLAKQQALPPEEAPTPEYDEGLFLTVEEAFFWIAQVWADRDKLPAIAVNPDSYLDSSLSLGGSTIDRVLRRGLQNVRLTLGEEAEPKSTGRSGRSEPHAAPGSRTYTKAHSPATTLCDALENTLCYSLGEGLGLFTSQPEAIHARQCNECGCCPIVGYLYHCDHCVDYDLCISCFNLENSSHSRKHILTRFPDGKQTQQLM